MPQSEGSGVLNTWSTQTVYYGFVRVGTSPNRNDLSAYMVAVIEAIGLVSCRSDSNVVTA